MGEHDAQLLLFGATGDLAANKILPALQQWETGTPFFSRIWCLGRRPFNTPDYLTFIEKKGGHALQDPLQSAIRSAVIDEKNNSVWGLSAFGPRLSLNSSKSAWICFASSALL